MGMAFALCMHSPRALGGSGGMLPLGFSDLRAFLVHSGGKSEVSEVCMASSTIV